MFVIKNKLSLLIRRYNSMHYPELPKVTVYVCLFNVSVIDFFKCIIFFLLLFFILFSISFHFSNVTLTLFFFLSLFLSLSHDIVFRMMLARKSFFQTPCCPLSRLWGLVYSCMILFSLSFFFFRC